MNHASHMCGPRQWKYIKSKIKWICEDCRNSVKLLSKWNILVFFFCAVQHFCLSVDNSYMRFEICNKNGERMLWTLFNALLCNLENIVFFLCVVQHFCLSVDNSYMRFKTKMGNKYWTSFNALLCNLEKRVKLHNKSLSNSIMTSLITKSTQVVQIWIYVICWVSSRGIML